MRSINILKKINRNAFNEKLIHRYLFERYYFGDSNQRKALLPERLQSFPINLIVPEDAKNGSNYRADLTIYFKNQASGIPVEVKWLLEGFSKDNQIKYIKEHNGFVVILGDTNKKDFQGIDVVSINHEDFADWISENISRLSRESLIYQAESKKLAGRNQYWLVFLKGGPTGTAAINFDRMLASKSSNSFWAFRQHTKALPYILDMQKGDKIVFLFGTSRGMAQPKNKSTEIKVFRYYFSDIIEPYYMALDNARGLFFEDQNKKPLINDRKWPHFVDFKIYKSFANSSALSFGKQGDYSEVFSNSFNHGGGTPYPLTRAQYEKLHDYLLKLADNS